MSEIDTSTEAIAALMNGVTPGPWALSGMTGPEPKLYGRSHKVTVQELTAIFVAGWEDNPDDAKEAAANASFIAASRELVPALAAERDALRAEVERLRGAATACEAALVEAKREMWIGARDHWTMEDFKNWAVIQQIQSAIDSVRAALKGGANG